MPPLPLRAYTKPAKEPADLLAHLQDRGLVVPDRQLALQALQNIGYYRLLIYMRALQTLPAKRFLPVTKFEDVLDLYNFDRELRLLCLDAIRYGKIPKDQMGFPSDWQGRPIWQ